jgi:hypothetical protein
MSAFTDLLPNLTTEAAADIERAVTEQKLTPAQAMLYILDLRKSEIEAYYQDLETVVAAVAEEVGINGYFEAPDGTVYKLIKPTGRFVIFKDLDFHRTKREGEERGTLSQKEAAEARARGFKPAE